MDFSIIERDFIRKFLPDFDWCSFERPTDHVKLKNSIDKCRVALVTTSGAYVKDRQEPFNTGNLLGDDSYRIISNNTPVHDISLAHPGFDTQRAMKDLDCVFPLAMLNVLKDKGVIGEAAPRHFSFMGYIPRTWRFCDERVPEVAKFIKEDGVDLAVLVPS